MSQVMVIKVDKLLGHTARVCFFKKRERLNHSPLMIQTLYSNRSAGISCFYPAWYECVVIISLNQTHEVALAEKIADLASLRVALL